MPDVTTTQASGARVIADQRHGLRLCVALTSPERTLDVVAALGYESAESWRHCGIREKRVRGGHGSV